MKTLTLDEYADLASLEPDEYLVEQFIPYPGRVLLVGPPKGREILPWAPVRYCGGEG